MQRPLVWVGIAYVLGEIGAAIHLPAAAFFMIWTAAVICCLHLRIILQAPDPPAEEKYGAARTREGRTGADRMLRLRLLILSFFFFLGFCLFTYAQKQAQIPFQEGEELVLTGKADSVRRKENSIAIVMDHARCRGQKRSYGVTIYLDPGENMPGEGDMIQVRGQAAFFEKARNPGQFDAASWNLARGRQFMLYGDRVRVQTATAGFPRLLGRLRNGLNMVYSSIFDPEEAGILQAMLTGEKDGLERDVQEMYRKMGTAHILAISGLHVSLIGKGIFNLLCFTGIGFRPACLLSSFFVMSYGLLTGMESSTLRAVIMFLLYILAAYTGRSYDMPSATAAAALLILVRRPLMLLQPGLQMSFAAILSLQLLLPALQQFLPEKLRKTRAAALVLPALAVNAGTIPLTCWYYGEIPILSIPVNLLVIPAMSLLVPSGLASGLVGLFWLRGGAGAGGCAHFILRGTLLLSRTLEKLPFAVWRTGRPPAAVMLICFMLLLLLSLLPFLPQKKRETRAARRLRVCGLVIFGAALLFPAVPFRTFQDFTAFLDVGQGDCIFLRSGGKTFLVDGGSSDEDQVGGRIIEPFLQYCGTGPVDFCFVTHGDNDHISGVKELLEQGQIKHIFMAQAASGDEPCRQLEKLARERGTIVHWIRAGQTLKTGKLQIDCLSPQSADGPQKAGPGGRIADANDLSLVLLVRGGGVRLLLTGDISAQAENRIHGDLDCDILKCPHHGSASSAGAEFLQKTSPKLTVISCSLHNRYGHPAPETVQRIRQTGSRLEYTMKSGAILVQVKKGRVHVKRYLR